VRTFRSDNNAGLCAEALRALGEAASGHEVAYGEDAHTAAAVAEFRRLFGADTSVFLVATGTAANVLAIASLTRPWQQVVCHAHSHYNDDESTAPERLTGCRVVTVRTEGSKLTPGDVSAAAAATRGDVHQPRPGVVTVSNPTEFGTLYRPGELREVCAEAHRAGYRVHVDGARFANAVAALGCDPRELAVDAGVDALSFGGTKNGMALGEAVLFFPQGDGRAFEEATGSFPFHRKSTGHLLSKHRYVAAPFAATLRDGTWLRLASHANRMAARLAAGLQSLGYRLRFPREANGVFVELSAAADRALREAGHAYYQFGDPAWSMFRLMCSFDTQEEEIARFLVDAGAVAGQ
jgi:threonine aldolase